ncbi:MAG TPA: DUF4157 domain-containing protein [Kofleriaceae bacterium]|nr:DUF4157 domain-containing protein [Kofleriaceae bacterium]
MQRVAASAATEADVHTAARRGVSGAGGALPHLATIQQLFGRHDVSGIQAHVGGEARQASHAIGAEAYAMGDRVAFSRAPDLHTAAHEAAHVVQQRGGVQLKGGVGEAGDPYERHADQVADAVVQGKSAEALLDQHAGSGGGGGVRGVQQLAVQRIVRIAPAQFLAGIGTDAAHATAAHLDEYYTIAVSDDCERAVGYANEQQEATLNQHRTAALDAQRTVPQRIASLGQLVTTINLVLGALTGPNANKATRYKTAPTNGYTNTALPGGPTWGTDDAMRTKFGTAMGAELDKTPALGTRDSGGGGPPLQQLPWADAKTMLPRSLVNLLFDVRFQLEAGGNGTVIDERTAQEQQAREKSPHEGGTLRSWHLDAKKVLPGNGFVPGVQGTDNVPAHGQPLHQHYGAASQNGSGASIGAGKDRPQGLAEYTGTGSNTEHNTKIVLDYMSKRIYLTLTHYQYWGLGRVGSDWKFIEGETQAQEEGTAKIKEKAKALKVEELKVMSPWMEIVMPTAALLDQPAAPRVPIVHPPPAPEPEPDHKEAVPDHKVKAPAKAEDLSKLDERIAQSVGQEPTPQDREDAQALVQRGARSRKPATGRQPTGPQVTAQVGQQLVREQATEMPPPATLLTVRNGVLLALLLLLLVIWLATR